MTATKATHTPGPWYAIPGNNNGDAARGPVILAALDDGEGINVADVSEGPHAEADANLIAAAPQLLKELSETIGWLFERASEVERIGAKVRVRPSGMNGAEEEIATTYNATAKLEGARLRGRARLLAQILIRLQLREVDE